MKKTTTYLLLTVALMIGIQDFVSGQDPNLSQHFSAPIYYNPAYCGINTGIRARFSYRDQWPSLPVDFTSYHFSLDMGSRKLPGAGGVGIIVNSDNEGIGFIKNTAIGLVLSVRIPLASFMVSQVGVKAAYVQKRVNWDDFVFSDQLNAKYGKIYLSSFNPPGSERVGYPDFAVGGILQFADVNGKVSGTLGFSVDHLFKPDESFLSNQSSPLPRRVVVHGDAIINAEGVSTSYFSNRDDGLLLNPGIIYQNQGKFNSMSLGLNMTKFNIYMGVWYKSLFTDFYTGAAVLMAGYKYDFTDDVGIRFMYSYDLPVSTNLQGTGGAHEVSLVLDFNSGSFFGAGGSSGGRGGRGGGYMPRQRGRSFEPVECPSFY
ncbi:MAG: type IX secretion system membrane protein PorP/SprF [Bacteroidetes bacterium]|nr:type IX secretion system membrane protein PorP/SprF [Bacteroidota bacterium]